MVNTTNYELEIFTVTDLSRLKKTAEGYPIPPTE